MSENKRNGAGLKPATGIRTSVIILAFVALAGCSALPDAVNPVSWYKGVRNVFSDDDQAASQKRAMATAKPMPGVDKGFPNLASVPKNPETSTAEQRKSMVKGLLADRENARYRDEVVRRRTDRGSNRLPPRATPRPAPPVKTQTASVPPRATPATSARSRPAPPPPPFSVRAEPPPPAPKIAAAPKVAPPAPRPVAPPPVQAAAPPPVQAAAPPPARAAAPIANRPLPPLVFGPPPTDIAIARSVTGLTRIAPQSGGPVTSRTPPGFAPAVVASGRVGTVWFSSGSARVGAKARRVLRQVARLHRSSGGAVRIVGHSSKRTVDLDPVQHNLVNFKMSLDRANSVARALMRLGVDPARVQINAMSDSQPRYSEIMPSGEAGNRRVEVFVDTRG